jgi:hypothetical protein
MHGYVIRVRRVFAPLGPCTNPTEACGQAGRCFKAPPRPVDPAAAGQTNNGGSWWLTFQLRVGVGCYGMQTDNAGFSEVAVIDFHA